MISPRMFQNGRPRGEVVSKIDEIQADRFKSFLPRIEPDYAALEEELWKLRNWLAHNSTRVAYFMTKTEDARGEHLEKDHDYVFVHTGRLLEDFKTTIGHRVGNGGGGPPFYRLGPLGWQATIYHLNRRDGGVELRNVRKPFPFTRYWIWDVGQETDEGTCKLVRYGSIYIGNNGCAAYWHLIDHNEARAR